MNVPEINIWAVVLATLSTMVVGSIWYTPKVFGNYWMSKARVNRDTTASRGIWPILLTVLVSFVTAWVLAGVTAITHEFYQGNYVTDALITAALLWAGFTAARMITHDAFEARPAGLTAVNLAHELVTVLVMAAIIGVLGV